jgi:four helix bundle protein
MSEPHNDEIRGRLDAAILDRFLDHADAVLNMTELMVKDRRPTRVINQLVGSGTSPGSQMFEAHEALSAADFKKCVGGAAKELSET